MTNNIKCSLQISVTVAVRDLRENALMIKRVGSLTFLELEQFINSILKQNFDALAEVLKYYDEAISDLQLKVDQHERDLEKVEKRLDRLEQR